ncbi:MAG: ABC transporter substrate-binding protein [Rikenellaceae bacterium]
MKKLIYILILTLTSCAQNQSIKLEHFKEKEYLPRHSSNFCIYSAPELESSVILVKNPWQGAKDVQMLTFIERAGEKAPRNFPGQVIQAPVERIVCLSSSYIAMLAMANSEDKIVGVSGLDYITNPVITNNKNMVDVGYDTNIDFEKLVALRPSVVLLFALNSENSAITKKLRELKIPYMYVGDYVESSPLGKTEWSIALGELVDKRLEVEKKFLDIEYRYNNLKIKAKENKTKAKVMLNSPYRDIWFMPSIQSYMVELISDAGGDYIYSQNTGTESIPITLEQAYTLAAVSDIWLNTGWHNTLSQLLSENAKFKDNPLVKKGRIYNNNALQNAKGGSDFWEGGVVNPDKVLQDLINIFQGNTSEELTYYKQLK